jgi:hypothetical protein
VGQVVVTLDLDGLARLEDVFAGVISERDSLAGTVDDTHQRVTS